MKTLETSRLILRDWQESDTDDFYAYASLDNVGPSAGWMPHVNKKMSRMILKGFINQQEVWAIYHKEDHKVIGSVGLHHDSKRENKYCCNLGYCLSPDYWGQGIIVEACNKVIDEAFSNPELDLISVTHYPFNHQSKRVIEKLGFVYEGCLRHASMRYDGQILDHMCYSMTREDYLSKRKNNA